MCPPDTPEQPVAIRAAARQPRPRCDSTILRMDSLSSTLPLCAAVLLVAAAALSTFAQTQRTYQGFGWWSGALWLNTGAAWLAALDPALLGWPLAQWLYLPWPILLLLGLRRFHARLALPGSARLDLAVLGVLLVGGSLAAQVLAGSSAAAKLPQWLAGAALLHAATMCWRAPADRDAVGLRVLGGLWFCAALPLLMSAPWAMDLPNSALLQTSVVTLGSLASAFVALASSSHRTEHELQASRRKLRVLANIDMLTQVPNRRRFEELARRALRTDAPGSAVLLLVDIDHFKQINDQLGHAAGDRALKLVSRCTLELLRSHDVAGRHGGDEFVLLLRRSSTHEAMRVAERLVSHLQAQAPAHGLPHLSLSFGIVQMRAGENIDETLQRADLALYEAKRLGRARAVADDSDDDDHPAFRSSERLGLTSS
jgi:diguanylate cyclase (GGDEF)-like protein